MFDPVAAKAKYTARLELLKKDKARIEQKIVDVEGLLAKATADADRAV